MAAAGSRLLTPARSLGGRPRTPVLRYLARARPANKALGRSRRCRETRSRRGQISRSSHARGQGQALRLHVSSPKPRGLARPREASPSPRSSSGSRPKPVRARPHRGNHHGPIRQSTRTPCVDGSQRWHGQHARAARDIAVSSMARSFCTPNVPVGRTQRRRDILLDEKATSVPVRRGGHSRVPAAPAAAGRVTHGCSFAAQAIPIWGRRFPSITAWQHAPRWPAATLGDRNRRRRDSQALVYRALDRAAQVFAPELLDHASRGVSVAGARGSKAPCTARAAHVVFQATLLFADNLVLRIRRFYRHLKPDRSMSRRQRWSAVRAPWRTPFCGTLQLVRHLDAGALLSCR